MNLFISVLFVFVLVDDNSTTKKRLTAIQIFESPHSYLFSRALRIKHNTKRTRAGNSNSFLHERLENEFSARFLLNHHAVVEQSSSFLLAYRHRGETRR